MFLQTGSLNDMIQSHITKQITFCLMYHGEETIQGCLDRFKIFLDKVSFQEVCFVSPQVKALNEMILKCQTEYLVPLDADILLNNNALERIENSILMHQHDPHWHSILFPLWDTFTKRKILALKVLRTKYIKDNLFKDEPTPDVEHFHRLQQKGLYAIDCYLNEEPIGEHVVKGPLFCYAKYRDVYVTLKKHGFAWDEGVFMGGKTLFEKAKKHFDFFLLNRIITGNSDYLWAIAGMMDGILSPSINCSKDLSSIQFNTTDETAVNVYCNWLVNSQRIW